MEIREVIERLAERYPFDLQENWDNSGLQVGDPTSEVKNVLVSLDLEDKGIDEAIAKGCNLIINHHPYLFNGIKSIDLSQNFYKKLEKLIKNDISVYALHTNLDLAKDGLNDNFAQILGLTDIKPLESKEYPGLGRYGFIEKRPARDFLKFVKEKLQASGLVVYGDTKKEVSKIALCGGAGSEVIEEAIDKACHMIITGDVKYHDGMDLANEGIIIVDPGHYASENHVIYKLAEEVNEIIPGEAFTYDKGDDFREFY